MDGGFLVPRATVAQICARRDRALALYGDAYDGLAVAAKTLKEANGERSAVGPTRLSRYNDYTLREANSKRSTFISHLDLPARDEYMTTARRIVDTNAWAHIIEMADLDSLMDKKAKEELNQQLLDDPPEVTVDNVFATLQVLIGQADLIFKRGIANVFSALDRRFKSHDGFKVGGRVILTGVFNEYGSWSYHRNHRDTIKDIERTFLVLDGRIKATESGGRATSTEEGQDRHIDLVAAIDANRQRGLQPHQSEAESDYFRIRCFMNGNAHIWFKRDDLVEKVNKLLAEYYGEVIPDGMTPEDDGGLFTPKTTLAKNYGFYPTPDTAAEMVIDAVALGRRGDEPTLTVLEPSAGTGNLARRCAAKGMVVDCVEIHVERAADLMGSRLYRRVVRADFLTLKPDPARLYDRVVMNPPFDRERDIDHVMHALNFLKPDGQLVAIMSAGTEFRETRKSIAFRAMIDKLKGKFRDLPPGSFASVGTYCNTIILNVWKDGRRNYW